MISQAAAFFNTMVRGGIGTSSSAEIIIVHSFFYFVFMSFLWQFAQPEHKPEQAQNIKPNNYTTPPRSRSAKHPPTTTSNKKAINLKSAGGGTPTLFYRQKYACDMLGESSNPSRATSNPSTDDFQTIVSDIGTAYFRYNQQLLKRTLAEVED